MIPDARCPHCKAKELRIQAEVVCDAPFDFWRRFRKSHLYSKRTEIMGVLWEMATIYCQKCRWTFNLRVMSKAQVQKALRGQRVRVPRRSPCTDPCHANALLEEARSARRSKKN